MEASNISELKKALKKNYIKPSVKAKNYLNNFYDMAYLKHKIVAKVEGNYGIYNVSIELMNDCLLSSCSCYVGSGCHHCEALAFTFIDNSDLFNEIIVMEQSNINSLNSMKIYLNNTTLDNLLKQLKKKGISQKAFAESIGMSTQHLSAIKSSELRNRYFHELGATKLACIWVLDNLFKIQNYK